MPNFKLKGWTANLVLSLFPVKEMMEKGPLCLLPVMETAKSGKAARKSR